jgi:putative transposase
LTGLKKNLGCSTEDKRRAIEPDSKIIPVSRQCNLLGLPKSTYYYQPCLDNSYNEHLMRLIDEKYTRHPFYGSPRMTHWLRSQGETVNHKRVERLMGVMGIMATVPGPHTSRSHPEHEAYPYLLRNLDINQPDQVWAADITYIRMFRGFLYLVAIMDWFSRYVLSWRLSNTLDVYFCLEALEEALSISTPEIFNTDQGAQFTSPKHTDRLKEDQIRISMDGRGRYQDNIFVERLWRTVKYEEVYLKDYRDGREAFENLQNYFALYNQERPHMALNYNTPEQIYLLNKDSVN